MLPASQLSSPSKLKLIKKTGQTEWTGNALHPKWPAQKIGDQAECGHICWAQDSLSTLQVLDCDLVSSIEAFLISAVAVFSQVTLKHQYLQRKHLYCQIACQSSRTDLFVCHLSKTVAFMNQPATRGRSRCEPWHCKANTNLERLWKKYPNNFVCLKFQ